ncbi:tetratricopeptide repeat protein [Abyssalbus ytuae]|uniref:Tetratricopeptide repeat protein n=1 Tax=Abyssalbus ytuae TaxID=2926907 RepID=A0A9E6ZRT1_9FLAO|nr:tetratricopeptide repeat protein [Abyssalbus ytuae]UOB16693.1 tetratricopeptide repeat protein [Abyssalbus ytuae]
MNQFIVSVFLGILFVTHVGFASDKNKKIDSLKNCLSSHFVENSEKVDLLNEIGYEYWIINPNESVKYGNQALELSEQLNYKSGLARSKRIIGVAHWAQGNLNSGLQYLMESHEVYSNLKDAEGQANTMLNIGMIYADLDLYEMAFRNYNEAINKFTSLNLNSRIATAYTKMAGIFINQGKLEEAKKYLLYSLEIHKQNNFKYGIAEVHSKLGSLYLKKNDTELAYSHIQLSMLLGEQILDIDGLINNYILLGRINRINNQLAVANKDINVALSRAKENHLKKYELMAYDELSQLKKLQGKPEEALQYIHLYIKLKDSLFNIQKAKQIAYLEFENQLQKKEREVVMLKSKDRTDKLIKFMLFVVIVLILLITFIFYKNHKKNKELLQKEQQLLGSKNELAKHALENSKLKEKELIQELEFKNKELTSYAINFLQKNEILQSIQDKVNLMEKKLGEALPELKQLKVTIRKYLSVDKEWEDFKIVFEKVHGNFYSKLLARHPDLKANDLKICSLTMLNLNIKETAGIMGISPESAKTARYRLRKKLRLKPGQEILNYLIEVEKS